MLNLLRIFQKFVFVLLQYSDIANRDLFEGHRTDTS